MSSDGTYSFEAEFLSLLPGKHAPPVEPAPGSDSGSDSGSVSESAFEPNSATANMGAAVSTYPPLGQVVQLPAGPVTFYALLETRLKDAAADWQVALWHTDGRGEDAEWTETRLAPVVARQHSDHGNEHGNEQQRPWSLQTVEPGLVRHYYHAEVAISSYFRFTARYRRRDGSDSDPPWSWARDEQHISDGTVLVNARTPLTSWAGRAGRTADVARQLSPTATDQPSGEKLEKLEDLEDLKDLIKDLNPALHVASLRSQCPGTQLWSLQVSVQAVDNDVSSQTDVTVGLPWGDFIRWFAVVRIWTPWLAPRQGGSRLDLDKDAVLCAFLSPAGRHLVFLAVSGVDNVLGVFRSDDAGRLVLNVRSDSLNEETATVLVAVGDDFEAANAAVMYHARSIVQPYNATTEAAAGEIETLQDGLQAQWLEHWYDGLGYCTWNALGQKLSEDKILAALDTLDEHGIRIVNLIIDDNWQTLDHSGDGQFQYSWMDFEADREQFPHGLKHTIGQIQKSHPNIKHIAVWHALLGYWGGISPRGAIAQKYKTIVVEREHAKRRNLPVSGPMTVIALDDVQRFYSDFYQFLSDCGVDGAKTDAQFMMDTWASAKARRELTTAYQDAWTVATLRHFSYRAISCMSQTPPILFHSQMPQNRPAMLVRNSDDFFPQIPASHPWHVWTNAYNSLLTQHLNILPDWDMFQTVHDYSGFHAASRCVSGGPIYITDVPGQHNVPLIQQMTGRGTDGKTVIFRPSVVGRAMDPYVGFHDNVLLKVGSYHGSSSGSGILGVFNVSEQSLTELIPLSRVPGVDLARSDALYVARVHTSGRVTGQPVHGDAKLTISLDVRGYEIVSVYPLLSFPWGETPSAADPAGTLYLANLGLVDKMAAAATVVRTECTQQAETGRVEMTASFKALGTVGLYVSQLPSMTIKDNFFATLRGLAIPVHCVALSKQDPYVLEMDMERAWTELDQKPMFSNEVTLTIYITAN